MKPPFREAIDRRVLVADGAMGTMLYAGGVFVNRSFEALNLADPDRVTRLHEDYVGAGADVIETNTFGANRVKLRAFGLADRLADINLEGARIAVRAARGRAYVAGAIGPLGVRIEPWGRMGVDEAAAFFREQAQALIEGDVDLLVLETFRDLNEIGAAIRAVRSVCDLPIVAQMTVEDDGASLDGTPPEQFAPALQAYGADVIGINCSIGPAHMLETIERMAASTGARLSAQPNAGRPRDVEGRTLYLTSPEYMASYARRFVQRGVRLVGGCCGTTPEHVRQMKSAVARVAAQSRATVAVPRDDPAPVAGTGMVRDAEPPVARAEKSFLASALARGRFVTMVEVSPPKGHASDEVLRSARTLRIRGVDLLYVPEGPSGPRMSALALAILIEQRTGIETVLQYSCRDRNLLGVQSDLLGAHAMGLHNVLAVTGDVRPVGDYPDATAVFDVDSIGLVNVIARLNRGIDIGGQPIGPATAFHVGVTLHPGAEDLEAELKRFAYKIEAGAEFAVVGPVFDRRSFERLHRRIESFRIPLVLRVWPLQDAIEAEFMANELPAVRVPVDVLDRMRGTGDPHAAAAEGVAIARELVTGLREHVQGLLVSAPGGRLAAALEVVDARR